MAKLETIEGIGSVYGEKLREKGIGTVEALLETGATPAGRQELEEKTGIGHALILEWVNLADLMRIKGVGEEYSDLLEEAGVDTVKELRRRVPENLYRAIVEVNEAKELVRRLPTLRMVADWVRQAKTLLPKVTY
jgi:predicted flap endonuclease-1-like 5' DNA nuclease